MGTGGQRRYQPASGASDTSGSETEPPRSFSPAHPRIGATRSGPGRDDWSENALQDIIDDLTEQIAVVDEGWTILAINKAWSEAIDDGSGNGMQLGTDYFDMIRRQAARGSKDGAMILAALEEINAGTRSSFQHAFFRPDAKEPEHRLLISAFHSGGTRFATIARYQATELMALTRRNRQLERSLVRVQEEERQRIGRDLHDSTAQLIVALQLCMIRLKAMHQDPASAAIFAEVDDTLHRVSQEIRALSFLLHPPPLEGRGLVEALDAMARGFARRTGLRINFWFDGDAATWDEMTETVLYRLAQEALANVHRHARARHVGIRLAATRRDFLHLVIEDDGIGITIDGSRLADDAGVGIAGMRSRIRDLGGRFSIFRTSSGTCLLASVRLAAPQRESVDSTAGVAI